MDVAKTRKGRLFILSLIFLSWATYSFAVLHSHNLTKSIYYTEFNAVASAISTGLFHVPLGSAYTEAINTVAEIRPTTNAIEYIRHNGVKTKEINDIANQPTGYALGFIYTIAMQIFGISIYSIFCFFSILILISHVAFVFRFNDYRFIFSPLCLFSLTLMIFTPYVTNQDMANQVPIAGYRYFTLLAMLPTIHVALEFLDFKKKLDKVSLSCLAIQVILIVLCNLVAKSGSYALVNIVLLVMMSLVFVRNNIPTVMLLIIKLVYILSVAAVFCSVFYENIPIAYKVEGVVTDPLWHRVWIGLGAHPEWPFEAVKNKFIDCGIVNADGTKGLHGSVMDSNGHCIWNEYTKTHPEAKINSTIHYDNVMRDEFFRVVQDYPWKVFTTFFYYKPLNTYSSGMQLFAYSNSTHKLSNIVAPILSLILLMISGLIFLNKITIKRATTLFFTLFTLTLSVCSMYVVAWGGAVVVAELVFIVHVIAMMSLMVLISFLFNMVLTSFRFMKNYIKLQNLGVT